MIYSLQKKFIFIAGISITVVITVIFLVVFIINWNQVNRNIDAFTDAISSNAGTFPEFGNVKPAMFRGNQVPENITPESQFSTRFFTVFFNKDGSVEGTNLEKISSVTDLEAREYAVTAIKRNSERGWISNYRYKIYNTDHGRSVVFVDGTMSRMVNRNSTLTIAVVLLGSALVVFFLIVIFSKKAVRPVAESYEKQKQFVTDANHELKTPLTLILANVDIAEEELGRSQWLDDIRDEGIRMTDLVSQFTTLSKMNEDIKNEREDVNLSNVALDVLSEFKGFAEHQGKNLQFKVEPQVTVKGSEKQLRQLVSILMDNAVKYCEEGKNIFFCLEKHGHAVMVCENTFYSVNETELGNLFDRFYRSDKARTAGNGYGLGLSIAREIVIKHHGTISAYKKDDSTIGFKAVIK